jgi:hypothetical protein
MASSLRRTLLLKNSFELLAASYEQEGKMLEAHGSLLVAPMYKGVTQQKLNSYS